MIRRWLAGQYSRPSGLLGRLLIGPHLDRLSRGMNRASLAVLELRPGETVVEVGFGGGDLLEKLLAGGANAIGIDVSQAMAARARRRFAREIRERRIRILTGSADRLPLEDTAADKAVSVNALYFWDDPAAVVAEFARILRPGGRLVLCFQSPDQVRSWPGHVHGFHAYGANDVAAWLEQGGFAEIQTREAQDRSLGHFLCLSAARVGAKA